MWLIIMVGIILPLGICAALLGFPLATLKEKLHSAKPSSQLPVVCNCPGVTGKPSAHVWRHSLLFQPFAHSAIETLH